jgi:broad specificity phosphatase PhoE
VAARRRIYLMRHAQVRYFEGVDPHEVLLTDDGRHQAAAARDALQEVRFDRVVTSGLPRTLETAEIVAPYANHERDHELREIESGELRGVDPNEVQRMMTAAFRGVVPLESRFLGGESVGELFDRTLPRFRALLADEDWDVALTILHGGVNRALLGYALTGRFIVRAVNHTPYDPAHVGAARETTMEQLWREYLDARERRT